MHKKREDITYINSILAVIYLTKHITTYINSILAVIYLTKLQNLINRPVMNCSI